jgi:hypothetical protein
VLVHVVSVLWTHFDYAFLLYFWERRVEWLWCVIVKDTRLSIVLSESHDQRVNFCWSPNSRLMILLFSHNNTWNIVDSFLGRLLRMLAALDREVVLWLISRMETPVCSLSLCLCALLILSFLREGIPPGSSATKVVPVCITINRHWQAKTPEDPTHFADHPNVGLAHVISHVEHHFN